MRSRFAIIGRSGCSLRYRIALYRRSGSICFRPLVQASSGLVCELIVRAAWLPPCNLVPYSPTVIVVFHKSHLVGIGMSVFRGECSNYRAARPLITATTFVSAISFSSYLRHAAARFSGVSSPRASAKVIHVGV
jgi:hypothetical protein